MKHKRLRKRTKDLEEGQKTQKKDKIKVDMENTEHIEQHQKHRSALRALKNMRPCLYEAKTLSLQQREVVTHKAKVK